MTLIILEQYTDTLSVVNTTNCLKWLAKWLVYYVRIGPQTSANTGPISSTSNFGQFLRCSSWGRLFVTTTLSRSLLLILSIASPLRIPCVRSAMTVVAPSFLSSLAARVMVLDVSARSSIKIAVRLATSPTSIMVAFCRSVIFVGRRS